MQEMIIDYIKRNRVSSTQVADCLGKTGAISNTRIVNRGHFRVGPVRYIYAVNGTNYDVHKQIENINDGEIVFIDVFDHQDKAVFGDIVSKFLILYRQAAAIVTNGKLRDAPMLIRENWPIWCDGFTPVGYVNHQISIGVNLQKKIYERSALYDGAIAVCDDTGVTVIPSEIQTESFYQSLLDIEHQEDIWFDCIDRRKYTTFETICLRRYLNE